jgi:hypothetical protein
MPHRISMDNLLQLGMLNLPWVIGVMPLHNASRRLPSPTALAVNFLLSHLKILWREELCQPVRH